MNKTLALIVAGLALAGFGDALPDQVNTDTHRWARSGSVGRNDYVLTNVVLGNVKVALSNVTNANGTAVTAGSLNAYTKTETDAKIAELAPPEGNYATVSNKAMTALQSFTEQDPTFSTWYNSNGYFGNLYAMDGDETQYTGDEIVQWVVDDSARIDELENAGYISEADAKALKFHVSSITNAEGVAIGAGDIGITDYTSTNDVENISDSRIVNAVTTGYLSVPVNIAYHRNVIISGIVVKVSAVWNYDGTKFFIDVNEEGHYTSRGNRWSSSDSAYSRTVTVSGGTKYLVTRAAGNKYTSIYVNGIESVLSSLSTWFGARDTGTQVDVYSDAEALDGNTPDMLFSLSGGVPRKSYVRPLFQTNNVTLVNTVRSSITNIVNEVKAEFWDSPMSINWTLRMDNGSMKLYATTNVNMSTL